MAYVLLSAASEKLLSFVQNEFSTISGIKSKNEFSTISGIKSKAQKLSSTLDLIKPRLEDAERLQITDRALKVWLQQLKDAAYVLDDILDECSIKSARLKGLSSSFNPKNIMFRRQIGNRLKEITRRLDDIAEVTQGPGYVNESSDEWRQTTSLIYSTKHEYEVHEWRQTTSLIMEYEVVGREDDKEMIMEYLLNQARVSDNLLHVYPIVGIGGLGKTILAQLVYNDVKVRRYFDIKIWICISEAFSINRILCSIIEYTTGKKYDALNLDVTKRRVQELLQGKRYLLVLDDVWNRSQELESGLSREKWYELKSVLSCGSKGSSILVSTRDEDVASIMGTCQAHHLSFLSENECWLLFSRYAFGYAFGRAREETEEFVAIGKEIVKKCGGLPLAAKALGTLLRFKREENEWLAIKDSSVWSLLDNITSVFMLSYFHLTPTAKICFSFCAIFPKNSEIMKEDIIHLWTANGFISARVNLDVEDIGNMIWNELCQKSFFQDIKMDDDSGEISFKLNNLVSDFAQSIMKLECVILENTNTDLSRSTHHISFDPTNMSLNAGALKKVESLRTLYQLKYPNRHFGLIPIIPTSRSLRVLCANHFKLSSLKSLIHLRYLELHDLDIETLPDSIYSLQKLEILKLKHFPELRCLPEYLTCLGNLRHLVIEDCDSLSRMFPFVGKLSCLRTLSVYIVKLERGHRLAELNDLNLGGKLSIKGLENVDNLYEAQEANLMGKSCIFELCLSWSKKGETEERATSYEQVLEGLQPHSNLKRLKISDYEGLCFPSWLGILNSLVTLELRYCKNCVSLSPIGKLPYLKKLQLIHLDTMRYLDDECDNGLEVRAFPSLEELSLEWLSNIEKFLKVERGEMFPRLSKLTFHGCPKLELPFLPSVKHLVAVGCNNEILRSISSFYDLNTLYLGGAGKEMASFPPGMLRNLSCLQDLTVADFPKLKELPNEPFNLALEHLKILCCAEIESLPEQIWEDLRSLRTMEIAGCKELRSLPDGIRHLTSLEVLTIDGCPALEGQLKEGTGEDWNKIVHFKN